MKIFVETGPIIEGSVGDTVTAAEPTEAAAFFNCVGGHYGWDNN